MGWLEPWSPSSVEAKRLSVWTGPKESVCRSVKEATPAGTSRIAARSVLAAAFARASERPSSGEVTLHGPDLVGGLRQRGKLLAHAHRVADQQKRRDLVWGIERKLAEDGARPIIFYARAATCWQPYVKGFTIMVNSIYNGWRMEDAWLDK